MKIGIPRALLYHYYGPFWEWFFEELGCEVIVSKETSKNIIDEGIKSSVPEICVPIKIFIGHSLSLLKEEVDYIFVPRMISIYRDEKFCPKFMGLPDMMISGIEGIEKKILTCNINSNNDDISDYQNYINIGKSLGIKERKVKMAAKKSGDKWRLFRKYNNMGYLPYESLDMIKNNERPSKLKKDKDNITIGLLGYVYNIYDNFINMDISNKLRELNVDFITFDMIDETKIRNEIKDMNKTLFWTFSNKLLGAGYKLLRNKEVDGIIHITAFGCGPDSFVGKLFEIESDSRDIPFMTIRIDEHTGENHLQTRIEAFIDMLKRKNKEKDEVEKK